MISLRKLAKAHNLRQRELADIIDTDQSVVSLIVNGHRRLNEEQIERLRARFGDAELAKFDCEEEVRHTTADLTFYSQELVEEVRSEVREELRDQLQPKPEDAEVIEAEEVIVPYVSEDLAAKPNTDVRELVRADKVERVNIMDLLGSFDFVQPVFRQAMAPLYNRGDLLFLRYVPLTNEDTIPDGEYMVDTMKYGSMLGHIHDDGDGAFTISYVNPLYSPLKIRKTDTASIAVVVNHLRAGGSAMDYDMVRMLNVKETQLSDALRIIEKSGDRADRLIEQFILKK